MQEEFGCGRVRIGPKRDPADHPRRMGRQIECQMHRVDQMAGRRIIGKVDRAGDIGLHDGVLCMVRGDGIGLPCAGQ